MSPNYVKRATTVAFVLWLSVLILTVVFPSDAGGDEKEQCEVQWTRENEKSLVSYQRFLEKHQHLRQTPMWQAVWRKYQLLLDAKHDPCGSKGERL